MRISVIGTGYVGLVSGVCLAEIGHQAICVDVDQAKVDQINRGVPPIYENGLAPLLEKNIQSGMITATTDLENAILNTELSLVAVGTPFDGDSIDLSYIRAVCRQIGAVLKRKKDYHTVVIKSTVVPGTTDQVVVPELETASSKKAGIDFGVGMNPEFLREGEAVGDFMNPDRIVLGAIDETSLQRLEKLYAPFSEVDKIRTNTRTAEMIKYTANSLLATMISFSNEIANLCSALGGIDVVDVLKGVHLDRRLSPLLENGERIVPALTTYLEAGCGFGGSCFPKDVKALIAHGKQTGLPMQLLQAVIEINERQPDRIIGLIRKHFPSLEGIRVAVLGLAFKPGTDDMRESPAIPVVTRLLIEKAAVKAYDPVALNEARKLFGTKDIIYCDQLDDALENAQVIVILTRWSDFQDIPRHLQDLPSAPLVIDGRRMLEKSKITNYEGIGL
ncbi:MAG: UDP-glucose/GDP-mannose dehydrogenase family protein [Desulfobacteraceae bacterium]|nr:UDP-glucose/GDP-mannose dehydrogenase family protein [Desulfobacteraceae bacterium]